MALSSIGLAQTSDPFPGVVVSKRICKFLNIPSIKRWILIPLSLNRG